MSGASHSLVHDDVSSGLARLRSSAKAGLVYYAYLILLLTSLKATHCTPASLSSQFYFRSMIASRPTDFFLAFLALAPCALIIEAQVPDAQKQALLNMASRYAFAAMIGER